MVYQQGLIGGIVVQKSEIVRLAESKVDLIEYFNTYVVGEVTIGNHKQIVRPIQKGGSTICPLHAETDASFKVFVKNGLTLYHCFGCGAGGTVVDLYRRIEGEKKGVSLSKDDAAKSLLTLYGFEEIAQEAIQDVNPLKIALDKVRSYNKVDMNPTFNILTFKEQNAKILSQSNVSRKVQQLGQLDRMLSAYVETVNVDS